MTAVGQSKFSPPSIDAVLCRPRLFDRLSAYADARVTLILGQAAQGKSVLAATWLATAKHPFAWINLDGGDGDADRFFLCLVQALAPHLDQTDLAYLTALPAVSADPGGEPDYDKYVAPLRERLTRDLHIVVDDLEQLATDAPLFGLLQALVTAGPLGARWMLLSRRMPPVAVESLNVKQQVLRIGNEQLAFTAEETRLFFQRDGDFPFSDGQLRRIQQACEGWIGGMVLLRQALEQMDSKARKGYLAQLSDRDIARHSGRYFDEALLAGLTGAQRRLVISSAVFNPIRSSVLQALFEDMPVRSVLTSLAGRHFFISRVSPEEQEGLYRFHNLLRDHLLTLFREHYPTAARRRFYGSAAEALEKLGDVESAVAFYLKAHRPKAAARVVERIGHDMVMAGRQAEVKAWMGELPHALVEERPWLLLLSAQVNRHWGIGQCFRYLEKALDGFRGGADLRGRLLTLGAIIDAMLLTGAAKIPIVDLVQEAEGLLTETNEAAHPLETTLLWIHVGAAHAFRGRVSLGQIAACQNALQRAIRTEHPLLLFKAHMSLVLATAMCGRFDEARDHFDRMGRILRAFPFPELICSRLAMNSVICLVQGRTRRMRQIVASMDRLLADHKLFSMETTVRITEGYLAVMEEDDERLRDVANYMIAHSRSVGDQYTLSSAHLLMSVSAYIQQRYDQALAMGEAAVAAMGLPAGHADDHLIIAKVILGLAHIHLGRMETADGYLADAEAYFALAENGFLIIDVHLARALWAHSRSDRAAAAAWLEKAFRAMAAHGYDHLMIISRRDLAFCAYLALALDVPAGREVAVSLLGGKLAAYAPRELAELTRHPAEPVRAAAGAILQEQHRSRRPELSVTCLGPFQVTAGAEAAAIRWEGNKARQLCMLLAAHDGDLSVEQAREMLWPESDPDRQRRNFKVTLHRLRKSLEPDMDKAYGSTYVHLQDNRLVLDKQRCRLDSRRFETLCRWADKARREGDDALAEAHYREALRLYGEDFLARDLFTDWTEARRTHLRNCCVAAAFALGELLEARSAHDEALACLKKIIALDPLNEPAYCRMMQLHARRGDDGHVRAVFAECRRALENLIGAAPGAKTVAVFEAAVAGSVP
jgi:ATP/maltotriose-dependent transcriptional regulator MalT